MLMKKDPSAAVRAQQIAPGTPTVTQTSWSGVVTAVSNTLPAIVSGAAYAGVD